METSGANKRPSEPQYQHSRIIPVPFPNGGPFPYFCLLLGKRLLSKISAIETRSARVAVKDYRQQFPTELKLHDSDDQGCNALTRRVSFNLRDTPINASYATIVRKLFWPTKNSRGEMGNIDFFARRRGCSGC